MTIARSYAALVADVQAMWDTTMKVGDAPKTSEFVAPNGTWIVRVYVGQNGYKKCFITSPFLEDRGKKAQLYSVGALIALLNDLYGPESLTDDLITPATNHVVTKDDSCTPQGLAAPAPPVPPAPPLASATDSIKEWASLVIQKHVREYQLLRLREKVDHRAIVAYATRLHEEQVRENIEATLQEDLPLVLPQNLHSAPIAPFRSMSDLTLRTFSFERKELRDVATTYMNKYALKTHEYDSALVILSDTHYPLLRGPLPLPSGTRAIRLGRGLVYVRNTDCKLSAQHIHALKTHFAPPWKTQVQKMCKERHADCLGVFDVFGDRACTNTYIGSLVLAKFASRRHDVVAPALSIESIVAKVKHAGHGSLMYELCTHMLFADSSEATASHGYMFAQCLDFDFWGRMDPNRYGKAFAFQLVQTYKTYHFEEECSMRSIRFDREDVFGHSASPKH